LNAGQFVRDLSAGRLSGRSGSWNSTLPVDRLFDRRAKLNRWTGYSAPF
jgi:hypothetical protein